MSSKKAMKQAQKQAYAKHRSNITNNRFEFKKKLVIKNKAEKKDKSQFYSRTYFLPFLSVKNKAIINIIVQANIDIVFSRVVSDPQTSKNKAPIIIPIA